MHDVAEPQRIIFIAGLQERAQPQGIILRHNNTG